MATAWLDDYGRDYFILKRGLRVLHGRAYVDRQKGRQGRPDRRRQQPSLPELMPPLIDLAPGHIVAPRNARQRLAVHPHSGNDLKPLRVAPPATPFSAQYLHRRLSLWLRTSITTSLWTSLTRSHHIPAGGLNRSVTICRTAERPAAVRLAQDVDERPARPG